MQTGLIFNIQRFSLHDGPGIRTTVFFKGCPLKCRWCHNPEGISPGQQLIIHHNRCLRCETCIRVCRENLIEVDQGVIAINRDRCGLCLHCVEECPSGAIELSGQRISTAQLVKEVVKDKVFFDESGGGVTISGGEPLVQPGFLLSLLQALKSESIHTSLDTSGYAEWPVLESMLPWVDLVLFDLKVIDSLKSSTYTGVSNGAILKNLQKLALIHPDIQIRVPLIPEFNDDRDSIDSLGRYLRELGLINVCLLPYHRTGSAKYKMLRQRYLMSEVEPLSREAVAKIICSFEQYGLNITCEEEQNV